MNDNSIETAATTETTANSISEIVSPSMAADPQASTENPAEGNLLPANGKETADQPDPETLKNERVARALATATKKERKAAERERAASAKVAEAQAKLAQTEAAQAEFTALLNAAGKSPDKALELLKKAGIPDLDTLARLLLQMDPPQENPNDIATRALKEAQAIKQQIEDEKQAFKQSQEKAVYEQTYNAHLTQINDIIGKESDTYGCIIDTAAQDEVLKRAYAFIRDNQIATMTAEEEVMLIKHCANELESELQPQAISMLERLQKIKKLGIKQNDIANNKASTDANVSNKDPSSESLDAVLETVMRQKPSKFITNESTVSSKPLPRTYQTGRKDDDAIQAALRAMEGK